MYENPALWNKSIVVSRDHFRFRFEIPEQLRSKVIRPDNLKEVMDCVMDKKLLEAE